MERKLTAILSADVKGYSRLMGTDEEGTLRTLNAYRKLMDTLIVQHRGRVVGSAGERSIAQDIPPYSATPLLFDRFFRAPAAGLPVPRFRSFRSANSDSQSMRVTESSGGLDSQS